MQKTDMLAKTTSYFKPLEIPFNADEWILPDAWKLNEAAKKANDENVPPKVGRKKQNGGHARAEDSVAPLEDVRRNVPAAGATPASVASQQMELHDMLRDCVKSGAVVETGGARSPGRPPRSRSPGRSPRTRSPGRSPRSPRSPGRSQERRRVRRTLGMPRELKGSC